MNATVDYGESCISTLVPEGGSKSGAAVVKTTRGDKNDAVALKRVDARFSDYRAISNKL